MYELTPGPPSQPPHGCPWPGGLSWPRLPCPAGCWLWKGWGMGLSRGTRRGCTSTWARVHSRVHTWSLTYLVHLLICSFLPVLEGNRKETQALSQGTYRGPGCLRDSLPESHSLTGTGHTRPDAHTALGSGTPLHARTLPFTCPHTCLWTQTHTCTHTPTHTSRCASSDLYACPHANSDAHVSTHRHKDKGYT